MDLIRTYFGYGFLTKDGLIFKGSDKADDEKETDNPETSCNDEQEMHISGWWDNGVWHVTSAEDLKNGLEFATLFGGINMVLDNDISMVTSFESTGTVTLNGNGHTIYNNNGYKNGGLSSQVLVLYGQSNISNLWIDSCGVSGKGNHGITFSGSNAVGNVYNLGGKNAYNFTVHPRNGWIENNLSGGSILTYENGASGTVNNSIFYNNDGASIYLQNAGTVDINECNIADSSAGIYTDNSNKLNITRSQIHANYDTNRAHSSWGSDGIGITNTEVNIKDCWIYDNQVGIVNNGTVNLSNENYDICTRIWSNNIGIENSGTVLHWDGYIYQNRYHGVLNKNYYAIANGNFDNNGNDGICNENNATFIKNGGNIYSNSFYGIGNHGGYVEINNGGDIRSNAESGIYNTGTLMINGTPNIYSNKHGIVNNANATIKSGNIYANSNYGVINSGTLTMTGGNVFSNTQGVWCNGSSNTDIHGGSIYSNNFLSALNKYKDNYKKNYGKILQK